jgi:hypothetical protein
MFTHACSMAKRARLNRMSYGKQRLSAGIVFLVSTVAPTAFATGSGAHPASSGSAPAIRPAYGAPFDRLSILAPNNASQPNGKSARLPPPRVGVLPDCGSRCRHLHPNPSRSTETTCRLLSGVAAAGLGVGVVLFLATEEAPEQRALAPSFRLRLSTHNALVSARWSF